MFSVKYSCKLYTVFLIFILITSDLHILKVASYSRNKEGRSGPTFRLPPVPLLFPPTAPTRIQFIGGIGIPLDDLSLESMTSGYVLKAEYFLPETVDQFRNQSNLALTSRRNFIDGSPQKCCHSNNETVSPTMFDSRRRPISRWSIYRILTELLSQNEMDRNRGRNCLLKSICELSAQPFHHAHGLLAEILHIILLPSMSHDDEEARDKRKENGKKQAKGNKNTKNVNNNVINNNSNKNKGNNEGKFKSKDDCKNKYEDSCKDNHKFNDNDEDVEKLDVEDNYWNDDVRKVSVESKEKRSMRRNIIDADDGHLTPSDDINYRQAESLGGQGIDCHHRFPTCPESLLARFSRIIVA